MALGVRGSGLKVNISVSFCIRLGLVLVLGFGLCVGVKR